MRYGKSLHQAGHDDQRRRIDDKLHGGRLVDVADERVQRPPQPAVIPQNPRRIPHRLIECREDVRLLQEGDRLRR